MARVTVTPPLPHIVVARRAKARVMPEMRHSVSHGENALLLILRGHIEFEHHRRMQAGAGSLVIVPAGVPHRGLHGRDLDVWSVAFCTSCLGWAEDNRFLQPFLRVRRGALPVVSIPKTRLRPLARACHELSLEAQRTTPETVELLRAHVSIIMGEVLRAMLQGQAETSSELVSGALEFIHLHGLEAISLKDVAAAVHRSPAYVTTCVRRATGQSVGAWICAVKVAEAARWLMHTDASLEEITGRVGWQDKTHFIRQFRKAYGQTPAAWRSAQRQA